MSKVMECGLHMIFGWDLLGGFVFIDFPRNGMDKNCIFVRDRERCVFNSKSEL